MLINGSVTTNENAGQKVDRGIMLFLPDEHSGTSRHTVESSKSQYSSDWTAGQDQPLLRLRCAVLDYHYASITVSILSLAMCPIHTEKRSET